jgi:hypothetical protein
MKIGLSKRPLGGVAGSGILGVGEPGLGPRIGTFPA